jgi:hypothetical protein
LTADDFVRGNAEALRTFSWGSHFGTGDDQWNFSASMFPGQRSIGNLPEEAKFKLIALYFVSQLKGSHLEHVCKAAADELAWQIESAASVETAKLPVNRPVHKATGIKKVVRPMVSFED